MGKKIALALFGGLAAIGAAEALSHATMNNSRRDLAKVIGCETAPKAHPLSIDAAGLLTCSGVRVRVVPGILPADSRLPVDFKQTKADLVTDATEISLASRIALDATAATFVVGLGALVGAAANGSLGGFMGSQVDMVPLESAPIDTHQ